MQKVQQLYSPQRRKTFIFNSPLYVIEKFNLLELGVSKNPIYNSLVCMDSLTITRNENIVIYSVCSNLKPHDVVYCPSLPREVYIQYQHISNDNNNVEHDPTNILQEHCYESQTFLYVKIQGYISLQKLFFLENIFKSEKENGSLQ